jgi:hypothetical protein
MLMHSLQGAAGISHSLTEILQEPHTVSWAAAFGATCRVEVQAFVIKMTMTAASVFVNGTTWLSIIYLVGFFFLCYLYLR